MKFIPKQIKKKKNTKPQQKILPQTFNLLLQSFHSFFFILQLLLHLCQFSFQPRKLNNTKQLKVIISNSSFHNKNNWFLNTKS